jgi:metallo-beta-lactamase family protein
MRDQDGTVQNRIFDGAERVEVFGEEIAVKADIYNFPGLSAHAGRSGLIKWISSFTRKPDKVFVTHGEDSVCGKFTETLEDMGFPAEAPLYKSVYKL